jgi:hypothetical protein
MSSLPSIAFDLLGECKVAFNQRPVRSSGIPSSLQLAATLAKRSELGFETRNPTFHYGAILDLPLGRQSERRPRLLGLFGNSLGNPGCFQQVGNTESPMEMAFKVESVAGCNVTPAQHHRQTPGYGKLDPQRLSHFRQGRFLR